VHGQPESSRVAEDRKKNKDKKHKNGDVEVLAAEKGKAPPDAKVNPMPPRVVSYQV
jgi:hypothetical protein